MSIVQCFIEMERGEDAEKMAETYRESPPRFQNKRLTVYISRKYKQLKYGWVKFKISLDFLTSLFISGHIHCVVRPFWWVSRHWGTILITYSHWLPLQTQTPWRCVRGETTNQEGAWGGRRSTSSSPAKPTAKQQQEEEEPAVKKFKEEKSPVGRQEPEKDGEETSDVSSKEQQQDEVKDTDQPSESSEEQKTPTDSVGTTSIAV